MGVKGVWSVMEKRGGRSSVNILHLQNSLKKNNDMSFMDKEKSER